MEKRSPWDKDGVERDILKERSFHSEINSYMKRYTKRYIDPGQSREEKHQEKCAFKKNSYP